VLWSDPASNHIDDCTAVAAHSSIHASARILYVSQASCRRSMRISRDLMVPILGNCRSPSAFDPSPREVQRSNAHSTCTSDVDRSASSRSRAQNRVYQIVGDISLCCFQILYEESYSTYWAVRASPTEPQRWDIYVESGHHSLCCPQWRGQTSGRVCATRLSSSGRVLQCRSVIPCSTLCGNKAAYSHVSAPRMFRAFRTRFCQGIRLR
jgi:hypothetical protein